MNILKNNLMIIFIITCLLFERTMCNKHDCTNLVAVTKNSIKLFSNGTDNTTLKVGLPTKNAAAYDPTENYLYVSDSSNGTGRIFRIKATENTANQVNPIVAREGFPVNGLVYSPSNTTLYWSTSGSIYHVTVTDGEISTPLTGNAFLYAEKPRGITIDFKNRKLYWINFCSTNTKIEESFLDGTGRNTVVDGLIEPKSVTVDEKTSTLYWTESSRTGYRNLYNVVNGTKNLVFEGTQEWIPTVIAIHGGFVFWINSGSGDIVEMPKDLSSSPTQVSKENVYSEPIGLFVQCAKKK